MENLKLALFEIEEIINNRKVKLYHVNGQIRLSDFEKDLSRC